MSTRPPSVRELFEAALWEHGPRIASPMKAERDAGRAAVMAAFDFALRVRWQRPRAVDVRAEAEAVRALAQVHYEDWPDVTAARLAELDEAERESCWLGAYKRTRAGRYRSKDITEGASK